MKLITKICEQEVTKLQKRTSIVVSSLPFHRTNHILRDLIIDELRTHGYKVELRAIKCKFCEGIERMGVSCRDSCKDCKPNAMISVAWR